MNRKFHVKQDQLMSSIGMGNADSTHAAGGIGCFVEMLEGGRL